MDSRAKPLKTSRSFAHPGRSTPALPPTSPRLACGYNRPHLFDAMRFHRLAIGLAVLLISTTAVAQEWIEYTSREDRFAVNFPSAPTISEFTYTSWRSVKLPARTYTVERGQERYSVTVVDYTKAEAAHAERAKNCEVGAQNLCAGNGTAAQGVGGWKYDVLGAIDHASQEILQRGSTVTYFAWSAINRINGRDIHLTNADKSRTFVQMHMHENRLYIFEATVPAGAPEPLLFQQSPQFLDADGRDVRYSDNYLNLFPAPKREGRGAQAP